MRDQNRNGHFSSTLNNTEKKVTITKLVDMKILSVTKLINIHVLYN